MAAPRLSAAFVAQLFPAGLALSQQVQLRLIIDGVVNTPAAGAFQERHGSVLPCHSVLQTVHSRN
jgi:hypothetical protein